MPVYRWFSHFFNWLYERKVRCVEVNPTILLEETRKRIISICKASDERNDDENSRVKRAESILENRFNFLNTKIQFEEKIDWHFPYASKLWRYNLHYFDYAVDLAVSGDTALQKEGYDSFKTLVVDWIEHNKIGQSEGWEPYPTSLRLVNWILAYLILLEEIQSDLPFREQLLKSLFKHALFLERNLEYHICGNHLIKNGKALVYAGLFFEGKFASRWERKGTFLLWRELDEQILEDGGHFERSPMYHLIVLQDYMEVLQLLQSSNLSIPTNVEDKIRKMLGFLARILHPDGNIPLLNDSAFGIAPHPQTLLERGTRLESKEEKWLAKVPAQDRRLTGYYVMRDKSREKYLIVDCGKIGPDYLPGHAHADTLSYELSIRDDRIIVDSGVYEYASGKWRDFYRSTLAHNTVVVDGYNQSDVWGSFRVGRRANPLDVKWIVKENITFFEGGHDGYLKRMGILHHRKIFFVDNDFWLIFDELSGTGEHTVDEYIHFHPKIELAIGDVIVSFKNERRLLDIIPFGQPEVKIIQGELEPIQGWYSEEFGLAKPKKVLQLHYEDSLPLCIGYALFPLPVDEFSIDRIESSQLKLKLNKKKYSVELLDNDIIGYF